MKKDYIIPTIFLINYEEESKLLSGSLRDADSMSAASDVSHNAMSGPSELPTDNSGNVSEGDFPKKNDWFFDDNAFSDFR